MKAFTKLWIKESFHLLWVVYLGYFIAVLWGPPSGFSWGPPLNFRLYVSLVLIFFLLTIVGILCGYWFAEAKWRINESKLKRK